MTDTLGTARPNRHNATRDRWALHLHEAGWTWLGIALLLGISRPRAHQIVERGRYTRLVQRKAARDAT